MSSTSASSAHTAAAGRAARSITSDGGIMVDAEMTSGGGGGEGGGEIDEESTAACAHIPSAEHPSAPDMRVRTVHESVRVPSTTRLPLLDTREMCAPSPFFGV